MSTLLGYMYLHMPPTFKFLLRMDGWIEILRLFNSILVISGRCEDDNESLVRKGGSRTGWGGGHALENFWPNRALNPPAATAYEQA